MYFLLHFILFKVLIVRLRVIVRDPDRRLHVQINEIHLVYELVDLLAFFLNLVLNERFPNPRLFLRILEVIRIQVSKASFLCDFPHVVVRVGEGLLLLTRAIIVVVIVGLP